MMDLEEDKRYGNSSSFGRYGVPTSSHTSHLSPAETLSAERKKSRRLGAISGLGGTFTRSRPRQSYFLGSGYLGMHCSI
jgi:hypothetical protein